MQATVTFQSHKVLFFNTVAFMVCFAAWMMNGVLATFLVDNQVFDWGPVEIGLLMGIPVLTGAVFRLPAGILTDKFGGRPVFSALLALCAVPMFLVSYAESFWAFAAASFGFGLAGASFAVGIAFTSVWYPKERQGTALGIFGAGNAGAALTTMFAPTLLNMLTQNGVYMEGWRTLPRIYAAVLLGMSILFFIFTQNKKPVSSTRTLWKMLLPLKNMRVWRLGLYYFLVFGCFVAFSQWLVSYFLNVYYLPLVTAGLLAASFSFPAGLIRALGGWLSDRWGARSVMYKVLGVSVAISVLLIFPRMEIYSPGSGVMALRDGTVTAVSDSEIVVDGLAYSLLTNTSKNTDYEARALIFPTKEAWQEPVVQVGQQVTKKQLLAKGVTRIFFQANLWVFTILIILIGLVWGVGSAAVFKFIPDYFPDEVGVVGGMVGVIGGLGGFFCPIIFGYLLKTTGLWTSCWMFMLLLSAACLIWLHRIILQIEKEKKMAMPPN
ncbi:MAG: MFS transporter [Saprospiraceae bacterium]